MTFFGADSLSLELNDPDISAALAREVQRQNTRLQLVASENFVSPAVLAATGSVMVNKFAEGYPGARYCAGCENVDAVESIGISRAKELFGAEHVNLQPHSGTQANMAVYQALLEPGDPVLAMNLIDGGHLSHGAAVSFSGRTYDFAGYGVDRETHRIDYDEVRRLALAHRPKLIVAGATAYPRRLDFARFRAIADEVGALLMADMAHYLGLVAGGVYPDPVPFADVVTSTTYKVLRGPRGGMIMCRGEHATKIDRALFPGIQGGPHSNLTAAKAVALGEAMRPEFRRYAANVVTGARVLAAALAAGGLPVITGGTDTHIVLADVTPLGLTGQQAERRLAELGIVTNKNTVPFDTRPPRVTSGLRFGTAAMTTAGVRPDSFVEIADLVLRGLRCDGGSAALAAEVAGFVALHPAYPTGIALPDVPRQPANPLPVA